MKFYHLPADLLLRGALVQSTIAILVWIGLLAPHVSHADGKELSRFQETALADVTRRESELLQVNQSLWNWAEVGLKETKSSALLITKLQKAGFEVESGVSGMPTAFVASYGSGKPIIGILAEYDALPEMSQKVAPQRIPAEEGAAGHACGHSGLGTGRWAPLWQSKLRWQNMNSLVPFDCMAHQPKRR